jgi:LuxR family transcriptional regulator, quorum-sensing system regulator SolR
MDTWHEANIHALLKAESVEEVYAILLAAARSLGFQYCAYGMRIAVPVTRPRVFMKNNYPELWQRRYEGANYIAVDPTVTHGARSVLPLVWSDKVFASCPELWEEAKSHGLRVGWAQSCHNGNGAGGLLTLARSHEQFTPAELRDGESKMIWLSHAAHESMYRLLAPKLLPETASNLTSKEIEVLRWTADGKTSAEVSMIMNIAERTVNFHVNNAVAKLGAANKTAATIKAALTGLL